MDDPLRQGIARALKNGGRYGEGQLYVDEWGRRWWITDLMHDIEGAAYVTEVTVRSPDTNRSRTFRITRDEEEKA